MRRKYPQCRSRGGRSRPHRKPQHQLRRRCRSTRCGVPQTRASDARGTDVLMEGVLTAKSEEKKQASKPASDSFSESAPRPAALGASAGLPLFLGGGVQKKIAAGASENSGVQFKCDCGGFLPANVKSVARNVKKSLTPIIKSKRNAPHAKKRTNRTNTSKRPG